MIFADLEIDFQKQNPPKICRKMVSQRACLNLKLFWLKIGHKIPLRRSQDAHMMPQDGFWLRFGGQLGAMWASFSTQGGPWGLQDASKKPSWGCLGGVLGPLHGQVPTRASLGAVLAWFWEILEWILGWNFNIFLSMSFYISRCRKGKQVLFLQYF